MKVLHLINTLNTGGAEKLLQETLPLYNRQDIQADLLLLNGQEFPFLKQLKEENCCAIYSLGKGAVYNPFLIFKIQSYLKKYDIVHAHLFPSLYWLALAKLLSLNNTKIVYTEHSTNNKRRGNTLYRFLDKFIYSFYDKIITIADDVDSNLKKHLSSDTSKFQLINNGIKTQTYSEALPYPKTDFFSDNCIILIQVSGFRKPKDQPTLIRALKKLPDTYKLLLVGEGPLLQANKDLVNELDLQERVQFLGVRTDVPRLLKTADIIVLSSHHEGLSLSSIEAMASGRPFIASDVPGLTEIVKGAGILFPKEDVTELATSIVKIMDDEAYYNKIVSQCQKQAKRYDINKMISKYIELYDKLKKY